MTVRLSSTSLGPIVHDVQGSAYALTLDKLILIRHTNYILLIVISPSKLNKTQDSIEKQDLTNFIDHDYLKKQFEYINIFTDIALKSKNTKNPIAIILFISKFDLLSKYKPDDSSSQSVKKQIEKIFEASIKQVRTKTELQEIPFKFIVGSSVARWGRQEIFEFISDDILKE